MPMRNVRVRKASALFASQYNHMLKATCVLLSITAVVAAVVVVFSS